jgi:hypothetical protein
MPLSSIHITTQKEGRKEKTRLLLTVVSLDYLKINVNFSLSANDIRRHEVLRLTLFFSFLVVLGFELRASSFLCKHSIT